MASTANGTIARQGRTTVLLVASVLLSGVVLSSSDAFAAAQRPAVPAECRARADVPIPLAVAPWRVEIGQPRSFVGLVPAPGLEPAQLDALPAEAEFFLLLRGLRAETTGFLYALYLGRSDGAPGETEYLGTFNFFDLTIPTLSLDVSAKRGPILERLRGGPFPLVIVARPVDRNLAGVPPSTTVEAIELVAQCAAR